MCEIGFVLLKNSKSVAVSTLFTNVTKLQTCGVNGIL